MEKCYFLVTATNSSGSRNSGRGKSTGAATVVSTLVLVSAVLVILVWLQAQPGLCRTWGQSKGPSRPVLSASSLLKSSWLTSSHSWFSDFRGHQIPPSLALHVPSTLDPYSSSLLQKAEMDKDIRSDPKFSESPGPGSSVMPATRLNSRVTVPKNPSHHSFRSTSYLPKHLSEGQISGSGAQRTSCAYKRKGTTIEQRR